MEKVYKAVNWNEPDNNYIMAFWEQNLKQFWIDTEYTPSRDKDGWRTLSPTFKDCYKKVLGGLTLLDTLQGGWGMNNLVNHIESLQNKALVTYMSFMEEIHSKSYSTVFTTLIDSNMEINEVFKWVEENKYLQYKARKVDEQYQLCKKDKLTDFELFRVLSASINLESHLFYSGFYLPLWIAGVEGKLVASSDIIKKIVQDESLHGGFLGMIARELYDKQDKDTQKEWYNWLIEFSLDLHRNEIEYIEDIYSELNKELSFDMISEVKDYLKYNFNRAFNNLGFEEYFNVDEINPIVMNGISLETTQHDFFSKKSTNYEKIVDSEVLDDIEELF